MQVAGPTTVSAVAAAAPAAGTTCTFAVIGSADGTGVSTADIKCTGAGVPVPISGAQELERYTAGFQGVAFSVSVAGQGAYLQFSDLPQVLHLLLPGCCPAAGECVAGLARHPWV